MYEPLSFPINRLVTALFLGVSSFPADRLVTAFFLGVSSFPITWDSISLVTAFFLYITASGSPVSYFTTTPYPYVFAAKAHFVTSFSTAATVGTTDISFLASIAVAVAALLYSSF